MSNNEKIEFLKEKIYVDQLRDIIEKLEDIFDLLESEDEVVKNRIWDFIERIIIDEIKDLEEQWNIS